MIGTHIGEEDARKVLRLVWLQYLLAEATTDHTRRDETSTCGYAHRRMGARSGNTEFLHGPPGPAEQQQHPLVGPA